MKTAVKLAPSILAADLARLGEQVAGTSVFGNRQGVAAAMQQLQAAANKAAKQTSE